MGILCWHGLLLVRQDKFTRKDSRFIRCLGDNVNFNTLLLFLHKLTYERKLVLKILYNSLN